MVLQYENLSLLLAENAEAATKYRIFLPRTTTITAQNSCHVLCRRFFICILIVAVVLLSLIIYAIYHYGSRLPDTCHSKECLRSAAAFKQNMDLNVDPCEDFYSYVCGKWADDHPRPSGRGGYNWFDEKQTKVYRIIRGHLETNVTQEDPKPVAQAKVMYKACLGRAYRNHYGYTAVRELLKELGLPLIPSLLSSTKISEKFGFDWVSSVAKIRRTLGLNVLVGLSIEPDYRDWNRNRLTLQYYYSQELEFTIYQWSQKTKTKNNRRPSSLLVPEEMEGNDEDEKESSELAKSFAKLVDLINPDFNTTRTKDKMLLLARQLINFQKAVPNPLDSEADDDAVYYTVEELQNLTDSHINSAKPYPIWQRYVDVLFAEHPDVKPSNDEEIQLTYETVDILRKLIDVIYDQPPALIELYIWMEVVSFLVDHKFNDASQEEDCAKVVHKLMGLAVSYTIADKNFLEQTKPRVEQMVSNIKEQFDQMVLETDWMDAYTKYASLEKSKAMKPLIGFPEWILDVKKLERHYQGLQISPTHHLQNWINALQALNAEWLRSWRVQSNLLWDADPTEVNAFHFTTRNVIVIPIAIIQYPFYHLGLEALNYGALGETLGHEITHGFDNDGRHYDKYGNEERWWSEETIQEYDNRSKCLEDLYSSYYVPEANAFINGTITLGENIADHGGLREALRAYRAYVKRNGPEPLLPGFEKLTHEQLLFISFGNQYCETIRPSMARVLLEDEHSPSKFRVLGVLSNMAEFSEAFRCPLDSKMNPERKCRVW
nr:neprilysin-11-like isoform X2 [Aedes albopictus]